MLSRGRQALKAFGLSLWQVVNSRLPGLLSGELPRERGLHKPSVSEHHTMNAHTPMLPSGAAANALRRDRLSALSDAGLAEVDFGPWDLADLCVVPSNEQWQQDGPEALFWLRLASTMVRLNKAELIERTGQLPDKEVAAMIENFGKWAYRFRTLLALMEAAQGRLPVALAALEEGAPRGTRSRRQERRRA